MRSTRSILVAILAALPVWVCLLTFPKESFAQSNPFHDPIAIAKGYKAPTTDDIQSAVITIDDYDNFKLGVDFAECSISNNPNNPLQFYAAWNSTASAGGNGYYTNDGYTWTSSNPTWSWMWGDVVVAYDSLGNLAYQNLYGIPQAAKVAMSSDNGQTWSSPLLAIVGSDKNWLAIDQTAGPFSNYLYSSMTTSNGGNVSLSTNQGTSWTNTNTLTPQNLPGMQVCVGPEGGIQGGAVYAVTNSGNPFNATYTFFKSTDGGQSFSHRSTNHFANTVGSQVNNRNAVLNTRTRPYPYIAADNSYGPHRGRLYLVYASNDPPGDSNKPDIYCRFSDDGANSWSEAALVNDDANTQDNFNWFPYIWCEKNTGRLYISWMDTRDCPTSDSCYIYATYTYDGVTFMPNQKVSNEIMKIQCPECGGGETPLYQGDYNGIAANSSVALLAWTDMRENNFGSYVGYFPDFALRLEPLKDTLSPYALANLVVPDVKLYTDTVFISASIPGSGGLFNISFPEGNKLWNYPGSLPIRIDAIDTIQEGEYQLNITATGSNGTPVHKRSIGFKAVLPEAEFTASDTLLIVGDSLQFSDLSTPMPSTWNWSFSPNTVSFVGGTSMNSQNPLVRFDSICRYTVSLTIANASGTSSISRTDYITIVDSVCQVDVSVLLEGLFNGTAMNKVQNENGDQFPGNIADQVNIELRQGIPPYNIAAGPFLLDMTTEGLISFHIPPLLRDSYYIAIRHRNSIETWSNEPISFLGSAIFYNFTDSATKAYGENLKPQSGRYLIYTGDISQDGLVDSGDMIILDNESSTFSIGYLLSDLNGDGLVDSGDMILLDNNGSNFIAKITP